MSSKSKINLNDRHYDHMLLALLPLIICACIIYSYRVLLICGTAFVTARIVDVAMAVLRKQEIDTVDKSSTVAALTFCMMLPVSIPLYVVVMTVALTILVGKHVFGGKDVYPFNLAALAMCTAAVNWPNEVFRAVKPFTPVNFWTGAAQTAVSGATRIKNGGLPYISIVDLLLGNHAGAMGTSFVVIIGVVGLFLILNKKITWHVPVTFLVTCAVIALAFPRIYGISRVDSLKFELLTSAIVFYAVFMLNEPATTPKNPKAKIIFGLLCGVLTMLFRYYGSFEIGGCFALLLINATEGYWDRLFDKKAPHHNEEAVVRQPAEKTPVHAEKKAEPETEKAESKKVYKAVESDKHAKAKQSKTSVGATISMISRAEDNLDQVEFSTLSIDVGEALKAFEEKYNKEDR
ncbi:MAG: RnfABCDGE type electron transport complex subunit D [Oscillospiraceae bacterium]|nr:RnfABCDGE type electron transport complex subunit D [Oscillospiraceae bacterium]